MKENFAYIFQQRMTKRKFNMLKIFASNKIQLEQILTTKKINNDIVVISSK
jgi:hypothetical protein